MIKVLLLGLFIGATIGYITAALMAAPNYSEIPTNSTAKDNLAVDCIDRQATLDAIIKRLGIKNETYLLEAERAIYQQILAMPSVTPQEPTTKDNLAVEEGPEINEVLDKIKAEIRPACFIIPSEYKYGPMIRESDVLFVIDKYRAESEDKK